jgi:hypothetical protein
MAGTLSEKFAKLKATTAGAAGRNGRVNQRTVVQKGKREAQTQQRRTGTAPAPKNNRNNNNKVVTNSKKIKTVGKGKGGRGKGMDNWKSWLSHTIRESYWFLSTSRNSNQQISFFFFFKAAPGAPGAKGAKGGRRGGKKGEKATPTSAMDLDKDMDSCKIFSFILSL